MLALETALPAKFEDTIVEALGQRPGRPNALKRLEDLPQRFAVMEADVVSVKRFITDNS
jgi:threonine synthase